MYSKSKNSSRVDIKPESPIFSNFSENELNDIFKGLGLNSNPSTSVNSFIETTIDDPIPPPLPKKDVVILNKELVLPATDFSEVYNNAEKLLVKITNKDKDQFEQEEEHQFGVEVQASQVLFQQMKWEKLRELWLNPPHLASADGSKESNRLNDLRQLKLNNTSKNRLEVSQSESKESQKSPALLNRFSRLKDKLLSSKLVNSFALHSNSNPTTDSEQEQEQEQEQDKNKLIENKSPLDFSTIEEWQIWHNSLSDRLKYSFYKQITNSKSKVKKPIPLSIAMTNLMFGWKVEGLCDPPPTNNV
ncbi:hypothetical protein K502DRAFT_366872 [Neoconidiobolus thromboides FSU 785]|nr:hypothetical protein K502DRAFT_366872 [Neoconidiobolus thromboides FSU 785]